MARSALYEESAIAADEQGERRKYKVFHIASMIFLVLAAIMIFFSVWFIPSMIVQDASTAVKIFNVVIWCIPLLCFIGSFFLFRAIKRRFNVSFDYTFVQDELRITKVFNGKSRKYLTTLKAEQMLKIGYVESDSFTRMEQGLRGKKPVILTPNREPVEGKIFIYIHYSSSIEKKLYVLECRKELLEYVVFAAGRNKFDPK